MSKINNIKVNSLITFDCIGRGQTKGQIIQIDNKTVVVMTKDKKELTVDKAHIISHDGEGQSLETKEIPPMVSKKKKFGLFS
jgi:hypothetical protein